MELENPMSIRIGFAAEAGAHHGRTTTRGAVAGIGWASWAPQFRFCLGRAPAKSPNGTVDFKATLTELRITDGRRQNPATWVAAAAAAKSWT